MARPTLGPYQSLTLTGKVGVGTIRVVIARGTQFEGRPLAPGDVVDLPVGFAQMLIQGQKARLVVVEPEREPETEVVQVADPVVHHRDPVIRKRRR